jgi:DNA replication and repair protein RecF
MLTRLRLLNFRNYDDCTIGFAPGMNILCGVNGQGKTNVLEGIYYLGLLRSFRTSQLLHLRQFGREFFLLNCEIRHSEGLPETLQVSYGEERKLSINGNPCSKAMDFITRLCCVAFQPSDLEIVQGSPSLRRKFLDILLCQLSPEYLRQLQVFNTVLRSRNVMLKQLDKYPPITIRAYDHQLIKSGVFIEQARLAIVEQLNGKLESLSGHFFSDGRKISLRYYPGICRAQKTPANSVDELTAIYSETLDNGYDRDCQNGSTRYGPHRGEMGCLLGDTSLTFYGSQGECRVSMLALRFAQARLLEEKRGAEDVLLLVDDVLGELDGSRRKAFLQELVASKQVIMTVTAIPDELKDYPITVKFLQAGMVVEKK